MPGAYCTVGHKGGIPVHNPAFILDEEVLPVDASIMARIVERRLPHTCIGTSRENSEAIEHFAQLAD